MQSEHSPARIHVVQSGQSLYDIAQAHGVSSDKISSTNQLSTPAQLVVGQALVIPPAHASQIATVSQGGIEVNAYIEPRESVTSSEKSAVRDASPYLTYLAPFSFRIKRDGTLDIPPLDNLPEIAHRNHTISMMVVTNLEKDQFSAELGSMILHDENLSNRLIDNILSTASKLNFRDIHFDIEHIKPEDRDAYNLFLRKAAKRIKGAGLMLSTALAPKTSAAQKGAWYTSHDYRTHGEIADFVVIMTYEWGYSAGPPMPVSPINSVRKVLEYAITEIPPSKIVMGQNLYGYDWTLPYKPGGSYARALSPQQAIDLARARNVPIQYDTTAQAPHFTYQDDAGKKHEVWFEDARSIQAKFDLLRELKLRGISYWKLGLAFPQNWTLLQYNFPIMKRE
ncbi:glycosyl hydrolase family 18 protein [Brevibacillus ginsengisoli]|uniref:glycosyl hydrolase family 18 protein n=1 Tax=Brevibacillus ginsengisoli TaxID=363854 RepID=UPI003CEF1048